jgi:transcriptional regulator with XRE-family HTH domain
MTEEIIELTDEQKKAKDKADRKMFDDQVHMHLGNRLQRRRKLLGLSQEKLAGMISVRFQQIQKYECAANALSIPRLLQISAATGVNLDYYFTGLPIWDRISRSPGSEQEEYPLSTIVLAKKIQALPENERATIEKLIESFKD